MTAFAGERNQGIVTAVFMGERREGLKGIGIVASSSKEKQGRVIVSFVGKRKEELGTVVFKGNAGDGVCKGGRQTGLNRLVVCVLNKF